nr:hypothetical protein [uncultured Rhodopila sp.]
MIDLDQPGAQREWINVHPDFAPAGLTLSVRSSSAAPADWMKALICFEAGASRQAGSADTGAFRREQP